MNDLLLWMKNIVNPIIADTRYIDALSNGQLESKSWLVNELDNIGIDGKNILVLGCWVGVLPTMLRLHFGDRVGGNIGIDKDEECIDFSKRINYLDNIVLDCADMLTLDIKLFNDEWIIVNTVTDHLTNNEALTWFKGINQGRLVAIQGNNFIEDDHFNPYLSLEDFSKDFPMEQNIYENSLKLYKMTRWMKIGYK